MAGRQFSFFLAQADQTALEVALRESGDLAFVNERSSSSKAEERASSVIQEIGKEPFGLLIARRADLKDILFRPIKGRQEFSCDINTQPVVEFSRFPSASTDRFIRAGRLYRIDKYWGDDGKLVSKPPEFIDWAERLYKLAKASLTKVEQGCYAGAEALELRKAGVAFEGLDIEVGSIKD
jgi:hypothetical protein